MFRPVAVRAEERRERGSRHAATDNTVAQINKGTSVVQAGSMFCQQTRVCVT